MNAIARPRLANRRGTTNRNVRGSTRDRAARRRWLVETFRANYDVDHLGFTVALGAGTPACRCYRCGKLLAEYTVTVDRIVPGNHGGTYRRNNIRPCCGLCNAATGSQARRTA